MEYYFDIERFKYSLDGVFKKYPKQEELLMKTWAGLDGQQVCFPHWTYGRVGYLKTEMEDKTIEKMAVLKDWCKVLR